jgi:hypothetical protein
MMRTTAGSSQPNVPHVVPGVGVGSSRQEMPPFQWTGGVTPSGQWSVLITHRSGLDQPVPA